MAVERSSCVEEQTQFRRSRAGACSVPALASTGRAERLLQFADAARHRESLAIVQYNDVFPLHHGLKFLDEFEQGEDARVRVTGAALPQMLPRSLQSGLEARRLEGLEQVIQGMKFKRPERVLIVSGSEDDGGHLVCGHGRWM